MAADGQLVCMSCGGTGGRFRMVGEKGWIHTPQCDVAQKTVDGAKNLYDFTTTHISGDGQPVHVESKSHLARLEKEHGVISRVGNYNEQNW